MKLIISDHAKRISFRRLSKLSMNEILGSNSEFRENKTFSPEVAKIFEYYLGTDQIDVPSAEETNTITSTVFPEKEEYKSGIGFCKTYPEELHAIGGIFHGQEYDAVDKALFNWEIVKRYLNEREIFIWKEYIFFKRLFEHVWRGMVEYADNIDWNKARRNEECQERHPELLRQKSCRESTFRTKSAIFSSGHSFKDFFQNTDFKSDKGISDISENFSIKDAQRVIKELCDLERHIQNYFEKKFPQLRIASPLFYLNHADTMEEATKDYEKLPTKEEFENMVESGEIPIR